MRKQIAIAVLFMLLFAGVGSSALVTRSFAGAKPPTVIQREKRLGPKPLPHWYWGWLHWRLTKSDAHRLRPKQAPQHVPRWAWRRFHFFQLACARVARRHGALARGGETYEQAIAYTLTRPAFTASRTILVSDASELRAAISNLQAGDLVQATNSFTVTGETVINKRLDSPASLDLTGVNFLYSGGANLPAVWLDNAQNLYIYNGDLSTADTGGACLLDYGSQHVTWWGFKAHDCGGGGLGLMPVNAPVDHDDFQGEIWKIGQNLNWDPHTEKGSGLHAVLLDDVNNNNPLTNNRLAIYAHDIPTGACLQAGNNTTPTDASGNTLYLKCSNETYVSTTQTGGNGIQFWGQTTNLGLDIKYLQVQNSQGYALWSGGLSPGQTLTHVTVEYGRANRTNLNKKLSAAKRRLPWDRRGGVVYKNVQPVR